jgi:hypothetical protein
VAAQPRSQRPSSRALCGGGPGLRVPTHLLSFARRRFDLPYSVGGKTS